MKLGSRQQHQTQLFWPRVVMRKWLNISAKDSDYSADPDSDSGSGSDPEQEIGDWPRQSRLNDAKGSQVDINDALPRIRRRKSETFRAQYINTKEIKVCVGTWNVAGRFPSEDLELDSWLDVNEPADIYVIGFQEVIPLNAGNIFGAEDSRPISVWEDIIRETLNKVPPVNKFKSFSDPPSPSRFKPSEDAPDIEEEIAFESDSGSEEEIFPINEESSDFVEIKDGRVNDVAVLNKTWSLNPINEEFERQFSSPRRLDRLYCFKPDEDEEEEAGESNVQFAKKLTKTISGTERIGLCWPERPLDLLGQHVSERPGSFKSMKSFKASKSFKTYSSFKLNANGPNRTQSDATLLAELDLEALINRKRKPSYVRIVSKQMVGVFLSVWVRRSLRKHIQNLNVDTVGVGVMGFIGNKGSVSVSMSIYQTFFCFICTHLTSGEKEADAVKRNTDVHEIHRRTHFNAFSRIGLPKSIHDHERIIWLGDLNYRINLSYERTRELISKKDWCQLIERDQLSKEFKKGRAFDGWSEGTLNFPPTYKYEVNSEKYCGEDPKAGRRNPAWCDRILSFGKGIRILSYGRSELRFSDHRPVSATYMVEVEVFSPRKLQRALTFTDAEIEKEEMVTDMGRESGMGRFISEQDDSYWMR
ncbi:type IV inositol polyphosphate 5-phosphatase 3 isoform X2 [Nicotiana tabacum]|uniref:Type I inositol 1,4,5-trisphosphate 5-phosphatase 1 isoform X2 n=2 Tax=Nicotiana sylvestris TaxID=4096 RepID=A0A1U7VQD6_NICSY|nr:PREDICTED: type I inositol 1,4,5-trisphosphate 5-phosphatase 1 isoform X2 [Nicotiana sylvestris]XP_009764111.1 PREDICTED: type I inositol 1,4,5-trisphosphate 5-phosphatase 1 isoform X2 [Nicotiana sylvestris]